MLSRPDLVASMVQAVRRSLPASFTVSVKIRLKEDLKESVEFVRRMEAAGVSFITIHARTQTQRAETPNYAAVKLLNEAVGVPVLHNGNSRPSKISLFFFNFSSYIVPCAGEVPEQ